MKLKSIKIGKIHTKNNVFLAPLAGYTDFAFRKLCADYGAGLTFTEMVSAKGLVYKNRGTKELLYTSGEKPCAVQIFGSEPEVIRQAVLSEELSNFDVVDINMGCPVPKIYNNGEGSALLDNIPLAEKIVSAVALTGKTVTVKIRLGTTRENCVAVDMAKAMEGAGASLITVHGRYRPDYYSGAVDFEQIGKVKNAVKIPVIANGGVFDEQDANILYERSGADGIMLARGALQNPFLFATITKTPCDYNLKRHIFEHIDLLKTKFEDRFVAINFRKIMPNYLKNVGCDKKLKIQFTTCNSTEEIKEKLNSLL